MDQNWWQGQVGHRSGIFPLTHVEEIQTSDSDLPPRPTAVRQGQQQPSGAPPSPAPDGTVLAKVRATMSLTAQVHGELSFNQGDIIHVTEVTDSDFGVGHCGNKTGSFPFAFVEVIEGNLDLNAGRSERRRSKFRWWEEEDSDVTCKTLDANKNSVIPCSDVASHQTATTSPQLQHSPAVLDNEDLLRKDPGRAVQDGGVFSHRRAGSYTQANTRSYDAEVQPYGKTLFPFISENENELTFFDNEIITLIRHVDDQWMEGEINGKRGIFPTSYIEIIVDCLYPDEEVKSRVQNHEAAGKACVVRQDSQTAVETKNTEMYGRVLYDFQAETEQDLALCEGDTVTILSQMDENWFQARHDDGQIGLCPVSFIEVIGSEPVSQAGVSSSLPAGEGQVAPAVKEQVARTLSQEPPLQTESPKIDPTDKQPGKSVIQGCGKPTPLAKPPPKPQLKPKPALKPKPTAKQQKPLETKTITDSDTNAINSSIAKSQHAPNGRSLSVSDTSPRPKTPPEPSPRTMPTFNQKTLSVDLSLDDAIKNELKAAKAEAEGRSCSATDSSSKSEGLSAEPNSPSVNLQHTSQTSFFHSAGSTTSLQASLQPQSHSVGASMFYSESPGGAAAALQNKPARPPPRTKKPPPPRPGGPRPASVPSKTPLIPVSKDVDYGPSPVPRRAAPPRPVGTPGRKHGGDLMDFSPEKPEESSTFGKRTKSVHVYVCVSVCACMCVCHVHNVKEMVHALLFVFCNTSRRLWPWSTKE